MVDVSLENWHLSHILHNGFHFSSNLKGCKGEGWKVKNPLRCQSTHHLMGSSVKTGRFHLKRNRSKKHVLFWVQNIKVQFGMGHLYLHIKPSLYVCRRAQRSQIFKQNSVISIHSHFIVLRFGLLWLQGVRQVGGWVSGVTSISLYEFRSTQR